MIPSPAWHREASALVDLPRPGATDALEAVEEAEAEFASSITDPGAWGPAEQLVMRMLAAGVDPGDTDAADAWLAAETATAGR